MPAWASTTRAPDPLSSLCAGAVACQIVDAVFPGDVPMSKVRWDAASPDKAIDNYKLVQRVFSQRGCVRRRTAADVGGRP